MVTVNNNNLIVFFFIANFYCTQLTIAAPTKVKKKEFSL